MFPVCRSKITGTITFLSGQRSLWPPVNPAFIYHGFFTTGAPARCFSFYRSKVESVSHGKCSIISINLSYKISTKTEAVLKLNLQLFRLQVIAPLHQQSGVKIKPSL